MPTLRGSGRITQLCQSPDGQTLAIASSFPLLMQPGRVARMGQRLLQRLALHRRGEARPFAVLDALRLPINDIAFHPSEPVLAVAAGAYDGGHAFEGELLVWNWQTGESWSGAAPVPEVTRCRFTADGSVLEALLRPWDEDFGGAEEAFDRLYPLRLPHGPPGPPAQVRLDPAGAIIRPDLAATGAATGADPAAIDRQLEDWFGPLTRRGAIWDLAFLADGRVAATHDDCLVEIHDPAGGAARRLAQAGLHGARLLRGTSLLVACDSPPGGRTHLLRLREDRLEPLASFEGSFNFVASQDGRVLGRLDRNRAGTAAGDLLLHAATGARSWLDLGHYDVFNHALGIDGAPELFLLQGTPPGQHERKRLCRLRPDGTVESLWPLLPADGAPASHAMECLGCHVADAASEAVILAGRHYDPDPSQDGRGFLFRRPIPPAGSARRLPWPVRVPADTWRHATTATASAMVFAPEQGLVVVAFLDGTLWLLRATDGAVLAAGPVTLGGWPTIVFALDLRQGQLALGTVEGCVAVLELEALRHQTRFELA
ncbi:hypothetical protein [Falsiroseomonas sp.]|uniref:hypothetical protein n=1 Tax=Falsiroseomonas sp. TaxID=2870721 RepID=UPI003F7017C3